MIGNATRGLFVCLILVAAGESPASGSPPAGMVLIPGGSFQMGDTFSEGDASERPVHTVSLSPYCINICEVTNAQYATALNWAKIQGNLITVTSGVVYQYNTGTIYPYCSTTSAPTGSPHSGEYSRITWNGSMFGVVAGKEDHPVAMVSWYGAVAYANWRSASEDRPLCYNVSDWSCNFGVAGYRLPTEAEWENAARGGATGHRFSWPDSDTIQHARANYLSSASYPYDTSPTRGFHPAFTGGYLYTSPVGYFAANAFGLYDMTGGVLEWCNDWYGMSYYSVSPSSDPTGPASGINRVLRGGAWYTYASVCRVACRSQFLPEHRNFSSGFRLALSARTPGDVDGDGHCDVVDLLYLVDAFGAVLGNANYDARCDFNGDGSVDVVDLLTLVENFGT